MNRPLIWGHRGAMDFAPQNTVPSFLLAQEQGADGVELDVQLTSDGVLVVFHDACVDKLTDGIGPIASLPWKVVKTLDAGSHFKRSWAGTRIPTLEEVLEKLNYGTTVNVELKTALSEEVWWERWVTLLRGPKSLVQERIDEARREAEPLAAAVAKVLGQSTPDRFLISSFDPYALQAYQVPGTPLGFLHSPTVPWNTPVVMRDIPHQAWHPHHSQVTEATVAREQAAGRRVNVWTVNDPRHASRLAKCGVDAIITNRPAEIRHGLG